MTTKHKALFCGLLLAVPLAALAQDRYAQSRGELLYGTHCDGCHTTETQWREKKQVNSLAGLVAQVRRWQQNGKLAWSEADVAEVTRYLDARFYHFPPDTEGSRR